MSSILSLLIGGINILNSRTYANSLMLMLYKKNHCNPDKTHKIFQLKGSFISAYCKIIEVELR